ncbi:hypothetical protein ACIBVL_33100 [Streptomyces sp. NPDC049687]|uniref:hypothetical protein n=1 Tax=Streptomyces sp. NPDC049687 TaxID=3365596 RepID=UPI00379A7D4A
MNVVDWLGLAYCAVGGTLFLRFAGRSRREGYSYAHRMRFMLAPDDFKTGLERAFGVMGAVHYVMGVTMAAVMSLPGDRSALPTWEGVLILALIVSVLTGVGLTLSIIWFNRPRFLVPPHMRAQPGTVTARRMAVRRRSR